MSEKLMNLRDLLEHEIKDLYSAETQLIAALPKMAKKAGNDKLKKAIEDHLEETKQQKERLDKVAKKLKMDPSGETCKAMKGLIKEGEDMMKMEADDDVRDAGLIASAQRVEHYEISGYGTAAHFARRLGMDDVADILEETLNEEKKADQKLNRIAKSTVNEKAEA